MSLIGGGFDEDGHRQMQDEVALSKHIRAVVPQPLALVLTDQADPGGRSAWDAIEVLSADRRLAVVFTYATVGADDWATIRLQGLDPDRRYIVRTMDGPALADATGLELMADGLQVPRRAESAANVLVVEVLDAPSPLRH
jgi:hypothetical protein